MKRIILLSGGLDSSTLLYDLKRKYHYEIVAIFFDYGQKSVEQELKAVEKIAKENGVVLLKENIASLFLCSKSSLIKHNEEPVVKEVKKGNHISLISDNTEVEFRNGVMLAVTISKVLQKYPKEPVFIYYGAIMTREVFSDCTKVYVSYFDKLAQMYSNGKIRIKAPYISKGKDEIYKLAKALGVPIDKTWSCYDKSDNPCGKCPACLDRKIVEV